MAVIGLDHVIGHLFNWLSISVVLTIVLCVGDATGQDPNVRLVGGYGSYEGVVEVWQNGRWGTVCNSTWDTSAAAVVCRQLDNRTAVAASVTPSTSSLIVAKDVPIWWHMVTCDGSEAQLQDCTRTTPDVDSCTHENDAGVQCGPNKNDLRLVGGNAPNMGRVEIYWGNPDGWAAVCGDSTWGQEEADVACRHVGYPEGATNWTVSFGSGNRSSPARFGFVNCKGMETKITGCSARLLQLDYCPDDQPQATVVCDRNEIAAATEQLSVGVIAGISIGFALVIVMCCLFSLNCKCLTCKKKAEGDDTDVYHYNTATSQGGDRTQLSSTTHARSEAVSGNSVSDSRGYSQNDSTADDPNLFLFAPKVSAAPPLSTTDEVPDGNRVEKTTSNQNTELNNSMVDDTNLFLFAPKVSVAPTLITTEQNGGIPGANNAGENHVTIPMTPAEDEATEMAVDHQEKLEEPSDADVAVAVEDGNKGDLSGGTSPSPNETDSRNAEKSADQNSLEILVEDADADQLKGPFCHDHHDEGGGQETLVLAAGS